MKKVCATIIATAAVSFASILAGCGDDNTQSSSETARELQTQAPAAPAAPIEVPAPPEDTASVEMVPMDAPTMVEGTEQIAERVRESTSSAAAGDLNVTVQSPSDEVALAQEMEDIEEVVESAAGDAMTVIDPTPGQLRVIQEKLSAAGYNPGPADGIMGRKTLAALERFQNENGLATGQITKQTLQALGVDD